MYTFALATLLLAGSETDRPTPAEVRIERALDAIERLPDDPAHYATLALAFARRARESAEPEFYERALAATDVALALDGEHLTARKQRTWTLLGMHRYAEALELARELNRQVPDDVQVYAYLVDAHVELGNYAEAEEACQWMLDLHPDGVPGLTRAAYLRELMGDLEGALDFMQEALVRVPAIEREDRAWILTHIGHLYRLDGRLAEASRVLEQALELFPDYHYALAQLGHVVAAEGDAESAAELFARRYALAPHPENRFDQAVAVAAAGRSEEAARLFAEFEEAALAESENEDNANRELVAYYADYAHRGAEALRIASIDAARRTDVGTLEALAWGLFADGQFEAAAEAIQSVLALGVAGPETDYRAGAIAAAVGDEDLALQRLRSCLGRGPGSPTAERARALLRELTE